VLPHRVRRRASGIGRHRCETTTTPLDLDVVTHLCPCGSNWWNLAVAFDDYEIAAYLLEMTCVCCGNKALAPTPVDRPDTW
jgi:hypothetical protein